MVAVARLMLERKSGSATFLSIEYEANNGRLMSAPGCPAPGAGTVTFTTIHNDCYQAVWRCLRTIAAVPPPLQLLLLLMFLCKMASAELCARWPVQTTSL